MEKSGGRTAQRIQLEEGRWLGFAEFGDPAGQPIFHFHGFPGSRLEGALFADAAKAVGARLIAVDRPGMGLSTFQSARTILDWPADVVALADNLGIDRFAVEGYSGGAPYAWACVYTMAPRLTGCAIIAGTGPVGQKRPDGSDVGFLPRLSARQIANLSSEISSKWGKDYRDVTTAERHVTAGWSQSFRGGPDPEYGRDPRILRLFATDFAEAFRQGGAGEAHENELKHRPWGFELGDIPASAMIHVWHGALDANVPIRVAQAAVAAIPQCVERFYAGEGHISLIRNHAEEILRTLVELEK